MQLFLMPALGYLRGTVVRVRVPCRPVCDAGCASGQVGFFLFFFLLGFRPICRRIRVVVQGQFFSG